MTTIAGSLITVAGLTFSITIVVLQLASSQFSPRVLPNFLADRMTQITVGAFVGIFVFCLVGLRAVGGVAAFLPRLTVTIASLLGVFAVILLIGFIHHVSTMIQVSHIAAHIGARTLQQLDVLHPETFGEAVTDDGESLLAAWRREGEPDRVLPSRPGYIEEIDLDAVARAVGGDGEGRIHVPVAPGDFVSVATPIAELWPAGNGERCEAAIRRAITVVSERNLLQDVDFGLRQLLDIALRAVSPSVNDPTTAVTCLGYVRSVLERLGVRELPATVRRWEHPPAVAVVRRRRLGEYLDGLIEVAHYAGGDQRVVAALLETCCGAATAAAAPGAHERAQVCVATATRIAGRADAEDRDEIAALLARVAAAAQA